MKPQTKSKTSSSSRESFPNILIVEKDNKTIRQLTENLKNQNTLFFANSGHDGLHQAFQIVPDLIICCVQLIVSDGYEICDLLKHDERTSHIPIIMLSSRISFDDRMEGLKRGADAFLFKPYHPEELLIRIEKLLELRKTLHSHFNASTANYSAFDYTLKKENAFLQKVDSVIELNFHNDSFGHKDLEQTLGFSKTQVYRKLKALTDKSVSLYIRSIRLKKALELLQYSDLNISQIAYSVGFKNPSHFSRYFKMEYGESPKAIRKDSQ